ncbi:DUF6765 family protein [Halodesulfovibrio marinisediminis]|uniref:Uncharacterized protein n=1 Tax=Halodesulfovibrio marinisediminis DSM 17456 TaxID=1121457 RepID=A0A1N6HF43_9BACT|nr:DUF6765 family protein [Halodesulfovibrio marinisediminis]SIO18337.1 hypothetical protein SAMN02745161_2171 [Halodesulfovibrio marinisediminis DSM 17456]
MQIDMHYYGTYTLARIAGLDQETAELIANSSQFVDDNTTSTTIQFADGGQMTAVATGHHFEQTENISSSAQRSIWIPFHFLPAASGDTFTERLICRKNSTTATEMVDNHLHLSHKPFAPQLMGIAAHVLADTFSHYNFCGASSRKNTIAQDSITVMEPLNEDSALAEERMRFFERFEYVHPNIRILSEKELMGTLGHGAVASYPDLPYLAWSYKTEENPNRTIRRYNTDDFMEAAEALYALFVQFANQRPDLAETSPVPFDTIQDSLAIIFASPGNKHQRSGFWQFAMAQGVFLEGRQEEIPPYKGQMWKNSCEELASCSDCALITEMDIYKFYQAAAIHRTYILQELLPTHDISVY